MILAFIVGFLWALAASYVRADAAGVTFRNGLRTHTIAWEDMHRILLRPGDAWVLLLIRPDDGPMESDVDAERRHMLGIQAGDGPSAQAAVEDLRNGGPPLARIDLLRSASLVPRSADSPARSGGDNRGLRTHPAVLRIRVRVVRSK